jgi:formylglycine-generating enzyme required for sulfatase activity
MDPHYCQISYSETQFVYENGKIDFPVTYVTWSGAKAFADWKEGRLPTEAEWEFAARGGNNSNGYKYSGSNTSEDVAWYNNNSDNQTHQVGTKAANELGIHDMSGNAEEWSSDWFDPEYYSNSPTNNPQGSQFGITRIVRGGCYASIQDECRVTSRYGFFPERFSPPFDNGFRIVK